MKDETLKQLTEELKARLQKKGIKPDLVPCYIRDLTNAIFNFPHRNILQINHQLQMLGWDDFEMDYNTLELAVTCFESIGHNQPFATETVLWIEKDLDCSSWKQLHKSEYRK